jgi:hypothetical protein
MWKGGWFVARQSYDSFLGLQQVFLEGIREGSGSEQMYLFKVMKVAWWSPVPTRILIFSSPRTICSVLAIYLKGILRSTYSKTALIA